MSLQKVEFDIFEVEYKYLIKAAKYFKRWHLIEFHLCNNSGSKGSALDLMNARTLAQHYLYVALGLKKEEEDIILWRTPRLISEIGSSK